MTAAAAIAAANKLRPDNFTSETKLKWLTDLENRIYNELYSKRKNDGSFTAPESLSGDSVLFAPAPYDEMYVLYICCITDFYRAEYDRYNNDSRMFDTMYADFCSWYANGHEYLKVEQLKG